MTTEPLTLAAFSVPIPLECSRCEKPLPKSAPAQVNGKYILVLCPKCGLLLPFALEAA